MDPNLLNIIGLRLLDSFAGGALWNLFLERRKKNQITITRNDAKAWPGSRR